MQQDEMPDRSTTFYRRLPKVDLHRHLEGSLRFSTLRELARAQALDLPPTTELRSLVQIQAGEPLTFENFLSKFTTLRLFYRSGDIIRRITREAIADAAADEVVYLELRFTPVALSRAQDFPLSQVMDWVIEGTHNTQDELGITTRLIASINRHESPALAAQVANLAAERMQAGIVGLDLAGNEADFPADPFIEIFKNAKRNGLHTTIHAGEWGSGDHIAQAISHFEADRIGHGIRILESLPSIDLALHENTPLEVCITSNYQSGAVALTDHHPIMRMGELGLNVTINSDDPGISQITLGDEYRYTCETMGWSISALQERVIAAAKSAFLPETERQALVQKLEARFSEVMTSC
jgi:adenosine deaminase